MGPQRLLRNARFQPSQRVWWGQLGPGNLISPTSQGLHSARDWLLYAVNSRSFVSLFSSLGSVLLAQAFLFHFIPVFSSALISEQVSTDLNLCREEL